MSRCAADDVAEMMRGLTGRPAPPRDRDRPASGRATWTSARRSTTPSDPANVATLRHQLFATKEGTGTGYNSALSSSRPQRPYSAFAASGPGPGGHGASHERGGGNRGNGGNVRPATATAHWNSGGARHGASRVRARRTLPATSSQSL